MVLLFIYVPDHSCLSEVVVEHLGFFLFYNLYNLDNFLHWQALLLFSILFKCFLMFFGKVSL